MATKGAKAKLEPLAIRLYAEGNEISEISRTLDVSENSLRGWKAESRRQDADLDEWELARAAKARGASQIVELYEEQYAYVRSLKPGQRTGEMVNVLQKLEGMVERAEAKERARAVAEQVTQTVKKAGLSDDAAAEIRRQILGIA